MRASGSGPDGESGGDPGGGPEGSPEVSALEAEIAEQALNLTPDKERDNLIEQITAFWSAYTFAGKPMKREALERFSTRKLEFLCDQMLLAIADGRVLPSGGRS